MPLTDPGGSLIGALPMDILRALSRRSTPMTAGQVVRATEVGTPAGIRRALQRLADEGVVEEEYLGDLPTYTLNYQHILYPAVERLLDARGELIRRLRNTFSTWDPQPDLAGVFGSVARGENHRASDLDILLIRAPLAAADRTRWNKQVQVLRQTARSWTGLQVDVRDISRVDLRRLVRSRAPIVNEWRRDLLPLVGDRPDSLAAS